MPLPRRILYASSARIGGSGLDSVVLESLRGAHRAGILGRAIAYDDRQSEIPPHLIHNLHRSPVRLLSWLGSTHYYGAKKQRLDRVAARELERGDYDLFHGWSGDCLQTLRAARRRGVSSLLEIPTWHRNKGKAKPAVTQTERERAALRGWRGWKNSLLITRQRVLEEYELATRILVLSEFAAETFLAAGVPKEKLHRMTRGVDVERFTPGAAPEKFRAVFVGALIERKGVPTLLEAWHRLSLRDAELVLVGQPHPEIEPALRNHGGPTVKIAGFTAKPEDHYRSASVHIFPSTCEGSAKTTYEAAACGLPQITTRESGDVVIDGVNGLIVPPGDVSSLAEAIETLYRDPALRERMGVAARQRVVENFTWDHFRARLLDAYTAAMSGR